MKKTISILMCAVLLLPLCGCIRIVDNSPTSPETTVQPTLATQPESTTVPDETAPSQPQISVQQPPMISLSIPSAAEYLYSEDGTLLFSYTYPNPILYFDDTAVSQSVLIDLLNLIDSSNDEVTQLREYAKEHYSPDNWLPYFVNVAYDIKRIDQNTISLLGSHVSYQGAIHPAYTPKSVTYDLVTGSRLDLPDILTDHYDMNDLRNLILAALTPMEEELYADYTTIVSDLFFNGWLDIDSWYLSDVGLCFYFAPYEIAPFASGLIIAEIPYEALTGILLDSYFPPEPIPVNGHMSAELFAQSKTSQFDRFSEVILDPEGEQILLFTDASIRDITICQGVWDEDGTSFYPESTVFAANIITEQDAILLQTYIPDTMPNLRLQYISHDQLVTVYISQSGKDGSILLIPG